jgi:hypothetical protein
MSKLLRAMFCCVLALSTSSIMRADDWGTPEPVSFNSRGSINVAEIFPAGSRQNPGRKPVCYLYEMGYPGPTWSIDAKLKWKAELVAMPYQALVSMDGTLVTLDEYGHLGFDHSVVVYGAQGKLVRSLKLDEIVPKSDILRFPESESSRWWTRGAQYHFVGRKLYVTPAVGKTFEISLEDGTPRYDVALPAVDHNALTQVWRNSLRSSSITDLLEARKK